MNTAIIGLGNIGSRLAKNLAAGGEKIIVAERTLEKADRFAKELGGNAQAMSVPDAIKKSDVVIWRSTSMQSNNLSPPTATCWSGGLWSIPRTPSLRTGRAGSRRLSPRISPRDKLFLPSFLRVRGL